MNKRLELENLIFRRAAVLHAEVWGKNGALFAAHPDGYLQALLAVYNRFFQDENQRNFPLPPTPLLGKDFVGQFPFCGGLVPFQNPACELFFEIYFHTLRQRKN